MIASVCSTDLDAVDRRLHRRVEILHAQARAVEADGGELADVAGVSVARIELDREIAVVTRGEPELPAQRVDDVAQLRRRQEIRRAAAEVQLDDFAIAIEHRRRHRDLAIQAREVGSRPARGRA